MKTASFSAISILLALTFSATAQRVQPEAGQEMSVKKHGKKLEQFFIYSETGELVQTGFYRTQRADLTWIQYNTEGMRRALAQYKNGVKQGTWLVWDEDGYLKYEIHYVNNKISHAVELDRTGALVASR